MTSLHAFVHGTLQLSSSFLLSVIALSLVATIAGLVMAAARKVSAAGRHLLLSLSLFFPLLAAFVASFDIVNVLRTIFPPPKDPPYMVVIADADLGSLVVAGPPSEVLCWVAVVWAIGVIAYAIASVGMWRRWSSIARAATDATEEVLLAGLRSVWNSARPMPRLALSSAATEPMVVGFVRPSILLPVNYVDRLSAEELRSVFAHETEHVRRRDNITALLHELACALFWFDPTKWIARRRLLDLRERACDERVIELGCEPEPYLTALAKSCHAAIESPVVACMSGFHVRERMDSIMSYQSDRARFVSNRFLRVLTAGATVVFALAFAVIAPLPAVAATQGEGKYFFEVKVVPRLDSRFDVSVVVFDPAGDRVMSSGAIGDAGMPLILVSGRGASNPSDEREYRIEVDVAAQGPSQARLEVRDGSRRLLHSATQFSTWSPRSPDLAMDAEPVSLRLSDADIHDVLATFSQLTGMEILPASDVQGRVTIDVTNMPWDEALRQVVRQVNAAAVRDGDTIRVTRRPSGNVPEPPPGYLPIGGDVSAPVIIKRVEPIYPAEARAARIVGIAIVQALVDENGFVTDARILKPLPMGLSEAAADAVKQWVFRPAMKDGVPVKVAFHLTVNFKLDDVAPNEGRVPSSASPRDESAGMRPTDERTGTTERTGDMPAFRTVIAAAPDTSVTPGSASPAGPVTPPRLIKRVEPTYLEAARRERTSGTVVLRAMIDETGVVRDTEVLEGLPNGLSEEAERAVRQWVFEPALVDGKPTAVSYVVTINFKRGS